MIRFLRSTMLKNEDGQSMITVALMLVVLFGFLAMAVDIGYAWAQRRFMQNAADAASLAAADLLASSVAQDGGGIYFYTDDIAVRRRAVNYAQQNRVNDTNGNAADATNGNLTLSYLDQDGKVLATSPTGDNQVPRTTARVQAQTRIHFDTFFARVLGINALDAAAVATAAITGSTPPTSLGNVWPFAVRTSDLPPLGGDFPLWDPNIGFGAFKGAVDFTMPCVGPGFSTEQCIGTGPDGQDPVHPGSHDKQHDVPPWVTDGFHGGLSVGNRLLTFQGDGGKKIADAMNEYILANCPRDLSGNCEGDAGGVYAYAYVIVWDTGEEWKNNKDGWVSWTNGNASKVRFRIAEFLQVKVYYLTDPNQTRAVRSTSFLTLPGTGNGGPVSPVANTVGLIE